MRHRILVAIAHPAVAAGVVDVLRLDPRFDVTRAPDPSQAGSAAASWRPEIVLVDSVAAARVPATLRDRLVIAASGDGVNAAQLADRVGARGWIFVDDVADSLARVLGEQRARLAAVSVGTRVLVMAAVLAAGALALRLAYLAVGTDDPSFTGWYTDSFHHWQIAYLTKEIGVWNGPRLWDLGGVEYFWGILPTLLDALLLALTFTTALWPLQALNLVAGSATVGVLYLVGRRYWSHRVGLVVAVFFAANPVSIFTDTSAMQEPVALFFLSLALLWFEDRPFRAGLMLGLAALARPDYWLYSLALLASVWLAKGGLRAGRPSLRPVGPYLRGYLLPVVPYMLHLWIQTGDPVYPLYWNFLGNASGQWLADIEPTPHQLAIQLVARVLLAAAAAGQLAVLARKPAGWPVLSAGLWGALLIGFMLGVSKYILAYLDRFWIDRIMLLLYLLVAVLVALAFTWLERALRVRRLAVGTAAGLAVAVATSALWLPTLAYRDLIRPGYDANIAFGARVASVATSGTIAVPGAAVFFTYSLVQHGVGARRLLSEQYHPDYQPDAPGEMLDWLRRYDVRWMAIGKTDGFFLGVAAQEPSHFRHVLDGELVLYEVTP